MTPLVIGLGIVVVVILIAVAVGLRYVRNDERADFAEASADRGRARGSQVPGSSREGQRPRLEQPAGRLEGRTRSSGHDDRPERHGHRDFGDAGRGQEDRRPVGSAHAVRGHGDHGDEPEFRTAQRQDARSQARGRPGRGRRDDDGDWPSTEYDKLSDADYWKEVASDRPLVTTARAAQPAQDSRPAAQGQDRDAATQAMQLSRRGQGFQRGHEHQHDAVPLPARSIPQPAVAGRGTEFLSAPAAARGPDPVRPDRIRPELGRPDAGRPDPVRPVPRGAESIPRGQRPVVPMPADDDPLTSPSFPKIVTSDSRSYHSGRPSGPATSLADQAAYGAPVTQSGGYGQGSPRPADGRGANGYSHASADISSATTAPRSYQPDGQPAIGNYGPGSYPPPARAASAGASIPAGPPQPTRAPAPSPLPAAASAAGNPYGSYVSSDLPGYAESPASAYSQGQQGSGYPAYPVGQENGHGSLGYRYGPVMGDSASPLGSRAASWYPEVTGAMAPAAAQGGPAQFRGPGAHDGAGMPGRADGNEHRSPSGYPPGPYPDGRHDVPGYPAGGYGGGPETAGYLASGRHSGGRQEPAGYLPPELYGQEGYGGQQRR